MKVFYVSYIPTPLGHMAAIADHEFLYLLDFIEHSKFDRNSGRLQQQTNATIVPGKTAIIDLLETELNLYFSGALQQFTTPVALSGSPFQKRVWQELQKIPFGCTYSYAQLAHQIAQPSAFRAVANANGANKLSIIIPCYCVINTNGKLGGYAGGLNRKMLLLEHEKKGL